MQRRSLVKLGAWSAAGVFARSLQARALPARSPVLSSAPGQGPVRRVLLVTKCHLDVGFTQTQHEVMQKYFAVYFPQAIRTAAALRERGPDRYTWTTGSWLLYEYLEQADAAARRAMEQAIAAGYIAWHALPFSWQTEMLTRSLICGALGFSAELDRRFGRKTVAAKMTDVPGHSRGLIAPLSAAGVRLLDIGVNPASTPPEVPDVFLWTNAAGNSLAVMYHRHDYGSVVRIPGLDVAVDVEVRTDNSGPHTPEEIAGMYRKLRAQFPGAEVRAATMNDVAEAIEPVRDSLPVLRSEIGDTWIYGVASDPVKIAQFREAARVRQQWIDAGRLRVGEETDRQLLRRLLLAVEHTWGTDTKAYLDTEHYRPADLARAQDGRGYRIMERSWAEKREDIAAGVSALPAPLRAEMQGRLQTLTARRPIGETMREHDLARPIETKHFRLLFDPQTGAMVGMRNLRSGREWAGSASPLALFTYQTLSAADYAGFLERYIKTKADWAPRDFGKPGIERFGAASREWHPRLRRCRVEQSKDQDRILLECAIDDEEAANTGNVAWPQEIVLDIRCPSRTPRIDLTLTTFGKRASRMPEAMWLTFSPLVSAQGQWIARKVDESVSVADVVQGGGRSMHAVSDRMQIVEGGRESFAVETLDAPLAALGERSPLNFSNAQPDLGRGVHFGLFNNAWGTNYPQWSGGDWQFRFRVTAT